MAIIPTKNPQSLIAYYVGILALLPIIGLLFAPVALVFGVLALRAVGRNPEIEGGGHAWVGIILALAGMLLWGGILVLILLAAIASQA